MRIDRENCSLTFSPRDLTVMKQANASSNELMRAMPRHPGLPPLWSKMPYLMLLGDGQTTAKYFWKSYRELNTLLQARDSHYKPTSIPKSSGGTRELLVPDQELRKHQKFILKEILYRIPVSECACAYHKRRGLTNLARPHVGHDVLLHFDIKNFFSSITEQMVFECLTEETGYPKNVAGLLCRLCCYRGHLPQGACTSPAISNICFKKCDEDLSALAKRYNMAYTRYSDDIFLSGNNLPISTIIDEVTTIICGYGFQVNRKKTKVLRRHQAQKVTAIMVNDKMQVSRAYRRQLRQELYYLNRFGIHSEAAQAAERYPEYLSELYGRVSFVLYVDPENREFRVAAQKLEKMIKAVRALDTSI